MTSPSRPTGDPGAGGDGVVDAEVAGVANGSNGANDANASNDASDANDANGAGMPVTSGFGPTVFDTAAGIDPMAAPVPASLSASASGRTAFDACHVGVVLRALLFVHGTVAVVLLFAATDLAAWLQLAAAAASVALPAVLLWLVLACGLKRWLDRGSPAVQSVAAAGLGAASAVAASLPAALLSGSDTAATPLRGLALSVAGAALAAIVFQWLQLRARATLPAATTARLAELQSRIRPHFLFNTLNTALTLVRLDPARAESVLEDLAELFRVAISDSGESVSLADEVELARRYIAIEQIRFGSRLTVEWDIDPAAGGARVPPLLLQPLVENAVRHGVEAADDGGMIRVAARVRPGRAVVTIVNSLPGRPSQPGHGMALRNVRERLRLMHDVASQFDARLDVDEFRVQLVVPL